MKKGFVFLETLVVMSVLSLSLVSMFKMYTNVSANIEIRKYYDNITDLYKTDILRNTIDKTLIPTEGTFLNINKDNCNTYIKDNCTLLLESLKVENIYINIKSISSLAYSEKEDLNNSMKEYLKTLNNDKTIRYIIVNYKYNNKNYYASLII